MNDRWQYRNTGIALNLARLGYELTPLSPCSEESPYREHSPEEMIIEVLARHPAPRYIEGLPVIILKNTIDYEDLLERVKSGLKEDTALANKVYWILAVTLEGFKNKGIKKDISQLEKAIEELDKIKSNEESLINPVFDSPEYRKDARENRDSLLERSHLLGVYPQERFERNLELYG